MNKYSYYFSTLFMLLFISIQSGEVYGRVDFILPGLFLDSLSVRESCSVRYLVVNEAFGEKDSTELMIDYDPHSGDLPEIRILSMPLAGGQEDTFLVRISFKRLPENIHSPDEFRDCIEEILFKSGDQPLRHPTEEELKKVGFNELFSKPGFNEGPVSMKGELVKTSLGDFKCKVREFKRVTKKKVRLGGIDALKMDEIHVTLWKSVEIPIFNLVKSRIERRRIIKPAGPGDFEISKPRVTVTTAYIIGYKRGH